MSPPDVTSAPVVVRGLPAAVDLYWLGLSTLRNALEDIEGADGREAYLRALRVKLLEACVEMDQLLTGEPVAAKAHRLALGLSRGLPGLGLSAAEVGRRGGFEPVPSDPSALSASLLNLGAYVLARLPGEVPDAQGPLGQGQTLRAMRHWSRAAAATGDDLGFLADRFRDL